MTANTQSYFPFVKDDVLKKNLDIAFDHVLTLVPLSKSRQYDKVQKSSFRKTLIIITASIIEALLLYLLMDNLSEDDISYEEWRFKNKKELFKVSDSHIVVAGDYKKYQIAVNYKKLNLGKINKLLKQNNIVSENLYSQVDKVRELRNEQHLGLNANIRDYSESDLQFVFETAKNVKKLFT